MIAPTAVARNCPPLSSASGITKLPPQPTPHKPRAGSSLGRGSEDQIGGPCTRESSDAETGGGRCWKYDYETVMSMTPLHYDETTLLEVQCRVQRMLICMHGMNHHDECGECQLHVQANGWIAW